MFTIGETRVSDVASNCQQQLNPCAFLSSEHINFHQHYFPGPHLCHLVCTSMGDTQQQPICTISWWKTRWPHQPRSHRLLFQRCHNHHQQPSACTYTTYSKTYHMWNCNRLTTCTHASPPTLVNNTKNPLLLPCHTTATIDCANSTIYTTNLQQVQARTNTKCAYTHTISKIHQSHTSYTYRPSHY